MIDKLHPMLRSFIINRLRWRRFTPIQLSAFPHIASGRDTLLIAPTASGKTEAVFIPVFDAILKKGLPPVSALYVSPLKALINDIYVRLQKWCDNLDITMIKWHGDVSASIKERFLHNPTHLWLITPESLESFLANKSESQKRKVFQNMAFLIIDEIHYFAGSDRGIQLNSLMNRLLEYAQGFQRIGLSATVGNPKIVLNWLTNKEDAFIVKDKSVQQPGFKVYFAPDDKTSLPEVEKRLNRKILLFSQSRKEAERYGNLIKKNYNPPLVLVHHSSLDKKLREGSEEKLKLSPSGLMVSTSTLELGIDIGDVDVVIQKQPPATVTSLVQRMGRSGRRDGKPKTIIFCQAPWQTLQALAQISLNLSGKIEDIEIPQKPMDVYFQQVLAVLLEKRLIKKRELFELLRNASVFSDILREDARNFFNALQYAGFLDEHKGFMSLGYTFEKEFGKRYFLDLYSVFPPTFEFEVREGAKTIGTLEAFFVIYCLREGGTFLLGGEPWSVTEIKYNDWVVQVKEAVDASPPEWYSPGGTMSFLVSRKIYDILTGNFDKSILRHLQDDKSQIIVNTYSEAARASGFDEGIIPVEFDELEGRTYIYTFAGLRVNALISSLFKAFDGAYSVEDSPFFSSFKLQGQMTLAKFNEFQKDISSLLDDEEIMLELAEETNVFIKNKFIQYLPPKEQANVKLQILFDPKNLKKLLAENQFEEVIAPFSHLFR